jgi:hypothetical protein
MSLQSSEAKSDRQNGFAAPTRKVHVVVQPKAAPAARKVYVPAAHRPTAAANREVPTGLLTAPAGDVFRDVAWDGAKVVDDATTRRATSARPGAEPSVDPNVSARVAFAQVAWTGMTPIAPTATQSKRSVEAVLKTFNWG